MNWDDQQEFEVEMNGIKKQINNEQRLNTATKITLKFVVEIIILIVRLVIPKE